MSGAGKVSEKPKARRPEWWLETGCVAAAAVVLVVLIATASWPDLPALILFAGLLVLAENKSGIFLPSSTRVSPSFMVVMAAITAYDDQGVVLGAALTGLSGGLIWRHLFTERRYRIAAYNCSQYVLAATAAALVYD